MNESKRVTSTARRINRSFLARLFWTMVVVDAVILAIVLCSWFYAVEKTQLGDSWRIDIWRSIQWGDSANFRERLAASRYVFRFGTQTYSAASGTFFTSLHTIFINVAVLEGIWLIIQYMTGKKRVQRLLIPLRQMTQTAQQLSQIRFDEEKYHHLEDAIARIKADAPDERLSTGDSDLQGLEGAINNLLTRMHDSYRQQARFVSDASHELRTPIAVIQGYAGMLDRWGKNDEKVLKEGIDALRTEAEHMQKLVEQLLFLARGDAGKQHLSLQPLDLSDLMREVYEEYAMIDKSHDWRLQTQPSVPAVGDPAFLKQTARILCDNAAKYSKSGDPITLRAYTDAQKVPCLAVQDNGVGISPEDIPHIFERFYRADPARTRQGGGTGLGLSIAKWIVDRHEGYFQITSREGVGTRVVVCLPKQEFKTAEILDFPPATGQRPHAAQRSG